jgi:carboxymethylenebutenolidase
MLCLFGEQDPLIPLDQTVTIEQALLQAGIPHAVVRYPEAGHGFVCNQRGDYRPDEAADAWNRVRDLFLRRLKEPPAPVSA